uniref:Platelet-derived growth factor (PDGF) family profile domain-containing protein n=1 Tax=Astyanax mexicanus TaxID=7994 RepID=A0A8B9HKQ4_ASTMX
NFTLGVKHPENTQELKKASVKGGVTHNKIMVSAVVVMLFHEVWVRSLCRSLEKMVSVEHEYPGGVEHIFSPGCVPLQRCAGCCNDEKLECFPTLTRNITMQVPFFIINLRDLEQYRVCFCLSAIVCWSTNMINLNPSTELSCSVSCRGSC